MTAITFTNVTFIKSAVEPSQYPKICEDSGRPLPEIAVAGRSNVGKSSLLNNLFKRKGLVKTSTTPGKTQLINFFRVDDSIAFVDLPGYGFAKVPTSVRAQWGPMIESYLDERPTLKLILFLFDIRRIPNDDDLIFLNWAIHAHKAVILVLTKIDKVSRGECQSNTHKILNTFGLQNLHHVHYSSTKNIGRKQLLGMINEALTDEADEHGTH